MPKCFIGKTATEEWLSIITPYDSGFVSMLKSIIPKDCRQWEKDEKRWQVRRIYLKEIVDIIKQSFPDAEIETDLVEESKGPTIDNFFNILFDILVPEYIDRVYKVLAQALHPDHYGGHSELMSKLNNAYEQRKRSVK